MTAKQKEKNDLESKDKVALSGLDNLSHMVGVQLRKSHILFEKAFVETFGKSLTPTHFAVICLIARHPDRSQAELADAAGLDRSSVVPILNLFEKRGWVNRKIAENDRRARLIEMTPAGQAKVLDLIAKAQTLEENLEIGLGKEGYGDLLTLLSRFQGVVRKFPNIGD